MIWLLPFWSKQIVIGCLQMWIIWSQNTDLIEKHFFLSPNDYRKQFLIQWRQNAMLYCSKPYHRYVEKNDVNTLALFPPPPPTHTWTISISTYLVGAPHLKYLWGWSEALCCFMVFTIPRFIHFLWWILAEHSLLCYSFLHILQRSLLEMMISVY